MSYKIIASDLDGTLFNKSGEISEENYEAIKKLSELGVIFMPSSGRTLTEIPEFVRNNEYVRYISYADGAAVLDKVTGQTLESCIEPPQTDFVLDLLFSYDALLTVRNGGISYVDETKNSAEDHMRYRMTKMYSRFIHRYSRPVGDFKSFCKALPNIEMICVFFANDAELEDCKQKIAAREDLICAPCERYNVEIFSKDAGKGNALLRIANHLGIDQSETIAVGDSYNDLDMILDTCERVILLDKGRIVADGKTEEILRDQELLEAHRMELPFCFAGSRY